MNSEIISVNDISVSAVSPLYPTGDTNETEQSVFSECPIRRKHEEELAASGIHQDMWDNYITNYTNEDICNHNIGSNVTRTNTGRASWNAIKQYETYHTGWTYANHYDYTQFSAD